MRGAYGKPQGTVARVHIGQPIMSVRASDRFKAQVIEALRRAKFKFPGRQKVNVKINPNCVQTNEKKCDILSNNYQCNFVLVILLLAVKHCLFNTMWQLQCRR